MHVLQNDPLSKKFIMVIVLLTENNQVSNESALQSFKCPFGSLNLGFFTSYDLTAFKHTLYLSLLQFLT